MMKEPDYQSRSNSKRGRLERKHGYVSSLPDSALQRVAVGANNETPISYLNATSTTISSDSIGSGIHQSASLPSPWACDYCRVATFKTYQDACEHERICSHNSHATIMSTTRSKQLESILLLAMPKDKESLSDRQCYVRSNFVEVFTATDTDVASRHSRGAQKLHVGQIGIRCVYCKHLSTKDRAERATCYPSSISRIYQTVADMQRFHFETCSIIPKEIRNVYKSLKTTRPRGMGSPQSYWVSSAKQLGLVDTPEGIKYGGKVEEHDYDGLAVSPAPSSPTLVSSRDPSPSPTAVVHRSTVEQLSTTSFAPILSQGSSGKNNSLRSSSDSEDSASMLLLLRNKSPFVPPFAEKRSKSPQQL